MCHREVGVNQGLTDSRIGILDRVESLEKLHDHETSFRQGVLFWFQVSMRHVNKMSSDTYVLDRFLARR